jgi:hypothetical protein
MGVGTMNDLAKLFAGHMGVATVLVNALTDKGVVGAAELSQRMRQARAVAAECPGAPGSTRALAEMVSHLDRQAGKPVGCR